MAGTFWVQCLLYIPLFLVINLVASLPGRDHLRDVWRAGVRHAMVGTATLVLISVVAYFLMDWLIAGSPWW